MSKPVAVITGGSRGIGRATLELLSKRGFRAVDLSRGAKSGPTSEPCDVRSESSVQAAFAAVEKRLGSIDALVNCAGVATFGGALDMERAQWDSVFETNVTGALLCSQAALASMIKRRSGAIVNVSSIAGRTFSRTASVAYTSSKYAVIGLTRQLAAEFAPKGVRVNCVAPSQTQTEMLTENFPGSTLKKIAASLPMGRLAKPREVASVIAFLLSEDASYVNGAVIDVNGGIL